LIRHDPRHELVHAIDRVIGDSRKYEAKICFGIDTVQLCCLCRASNYAERSAYATRYLALRIFARHALLRDEIEFEFLLLKTKICIQTKSPR